MDALDNTKELSRLANHVSSNVTLDEFKAKSVNEFFSLMESIRPIMVDHYTEYFKQLYSESNHASLKSIVEIYKLYVEACKKQNDDRHLSTAQYYLNIYNSRIVSTPAADKYSNTIAFEYATSALATYRSNFSNQDLLAIVSPDYRIREEYTIANKRYKASLEDFETFVKDNSIDVETLNLLLKHFGVSLPSNCFNSDAAVLPFSSSPYALKQKYEEGNYEEIILKMISSLDKYYANWLQNVDAVTVLIPKLIEKMVAISLNEDFCNYYKSILEHRHLSTVADFSELNETLISKYSDAKAIYDYYDFGKRMLKQLLSQLDRFIEALTYNERKEYLERCDYYYVTEDAKNTLIETSTHLRRKLKELESKYISNLIEKADLDNEFLGALEYPGILVWDTDSNGQTIFHGAWESAKSIQLLKDAVISAKKKEEEVLADFDDEHDESYLEKEINEVSAKVDDKLPLLADPPMDESEIEQLSNAIINISNSLSLNCDRLLARFEDFRTSSLIDAYKYYEKHAVKIYIYNRTLSYLSKRQLEKVPAITGPYLVGLSLLPIKGISNPMRKYLSNYGIRDISGLLASARTHTDRIALATKLSLYSPDVTVEDITSWVEQADLWRVTNMKPDYAYLMVQAGIRCVRDLASVDANKLLEVLLPLAYAQPDFDAPSLDELINLISNAKMKVESGDEYQLTFSANENDNLSHLQSSIVDVIENHKSDMQVLSEGLSILDTMTVSLALPSHFIGTVSFAEANGRTRPLNDATVVVEGLTSTSTSDTTKEISTFTDSKGYFDLCLPEDYGMAETLRFIITQDANRIEFVKSAREVMDRVFSPAQCQDRERIYAPQLLNLLNQANQLTKEVLRAKQQQEEIARRDSDIEELMATLTHLAPEDPLYDSVSLQFAEKTAQRMYDEENQTLTRLKEEIASKTAQCQEILSKVTAADLTTNDFGSLLKNLISEMPLSADLGEFLVDEDAFRGYTDLRPRALPAVKLMGNEDEITGKSNVVYLPTDTAPTKVYNYSILHRLVEPEIRFLDTKGRGHWRSVPRVSLKNAISVDDFNADLKNRNSQAPFMASLGFGYALNMHQAWRPDGFALGELLYSLILAPGEEQRLIVRENTESFTVTDDADAEDIITETYDDEQTEDTQSAFDDAIRQLSTGKSSLSTKSSGWSIGGGLAGAYDGFSGGITGGYSSSKSNSSFSASQNNSHSEVSSAAKQFQHAIKTSSEKISQARRLSMRIASSSDSHSVATKIVANHNHMHTLTVQYWEVMRRYRLETCIDGVDLLLFVPLKPINFLEGVPSFSSQSEINKENLRKRYEVVIRNYETLYRAVPRKYRYGLSLMQKYASMPTWELQKSPLTDDEHQPVVTLTLKGNFLFYDDINVQLLLKHNKGKVAGVVRSSDLKINSLDDFSVPGLIEKARTARTRQDVLSIIKWLRKQTDEATLTISFNLPCGTIMQDLDTFIISRQSDAIDYTYFMYNQKGKYKEWEWEAITNYEKKLQHFAQDTINSGGDQKDIEHYKTGLPDCYLYPTITLSSTELMGASVVEITSATATFKQTMSQRISTDVRVSLNYNSLGYNSLYYKVGDSTPILSLSDLQKMEMVFEHLNANTIRYSQAIWAALSADERAIMLEQYHIELDKDTHFPLLNCVNVKKLAGFYGNCMLLPFTMPQPMANKLQKSAADIQDELYRYHTNNFRVPTTTISLPTQGMIGEAVLGETNVAEEIDLTRFWNWQDAPIDHLEIDDKYLDNNDSLAADNATTSTIKSLNLDSAKAPETLSGLDLLAELIKKNQTASFSDLTNLASAAALAKNTQDAAAAGLKTTYDNTTDMVGEYLDYYQKAHAEANKDKIADEKKRIADEKEKGVITDAQKAAAEKKEALAEVIRKNEESLKKFADSELRISDKKSEVESLNSLKKECENRINEINESLENPKLTDEEREKLQLDLEIANSSKAAVEDKLKDSEADLKEYEDEYKSNLSDYAEATLESQLLEEQAQREYDREFCNLKSQAMDYALSKYDDDPNALPLNDKDIKNCVKEALETNYSVEKLIDKKLAEKSAETKPTQTKPTQTDPTQTDPTQTDPTQTDPTQTDPTQTKPTQTDPAQTKPTKPNKPNKPNKPEPTEPEPTETKPTESEFDGNALYMSSNNLKNMAATMELQSQENRLMFIKSELDLLQQHGITCDSSMSELRKILEIEFNQAQLHQTSVFNNGLNANQYCQLMTFMVNLSKSKMDYLIADILGKELPDDIEDEETSDSEEDGWGVNYGLRDIGHFTSDFCEKKDTLIHELSRWALLCDSDKKYIAKFKQQEYTALADMSTNPISYTSAEFSILFNQLDLAFRGNESLFSDGCPYVVALTIYHYLETASESRRFEMARRFRPGLKESDIQAPVDDPKDFIYDHDPE